MAVVYLIQETVYGNNFTDMDYEPCEIVYATLDEGLARAALDRLVTGYAADRAKRRYTAYPLGWELITVELVEAQKEGR